MTRFGRLCMLLTVLMLCMGIAAAENDIQYKPGDWIHLGVYEQGKGETYVGEAIPWIFLDVQDDKALLLCADVFEVRQYNSQKQKTTWPASLINGWLNRDFFNSVFDADEASIILPTTVMNDKTQNNSEWETTEQSTSKDNRLFLLSYAEVRRYLKSNDSRIAYASYFVDLGLIKSVFSDGAIDWWLRSPGKDDNSCACVYANGEIGSKWVTDKLGVRPAMWIDLKAYSAGWYRADEFLYGMDLIVSKAHDEAESVLTALGEYWGTKELLHANGYLKAITLRDAGQYDEALALFETYGNTTGEDIKNDLIWLYGYDEDAFRADFPQLDTESNANLEGRECRYLKAVDAQKAGNYKEAIKFFDEVGQYKDSTARIKACYDQQSILYPKAVLSEAGNKGYAKDNAISSKDKHYGWQLGEFFITGFTSVENRHSDRPVLIKTLGDAVTLRFDLQQDIDRLNGKDNLSISGDSDGFYEAFQTQKSDIGRGTLFIRHTDFQNRVSVKPAYKDYLLAKGTSAANTTVILNEEGVYDVALCYEMYDNAILSKAHPFSNYKITFSFEVRNGNSMAFVFDIGTRGELLNEQTTANGFYIDLANSHYVDVNVKRTVVTEDASGVHEDVRFNRPAKDHEEFKQEGIYTIEITSTSGEKTTKTIYVEPAV